MSAMASENASLMIVYSAVYSGVDERKHQSSALLAFVRGIHRWPVNSPQKGPVTRKMFPFGDVIMYMYCHDKLFIHSQECYVGRYFPYWFAAWEINHKMTLVSA